MTSEIDGGQYDKVTQASMNSLYVKAQELDRGHNEREAPFAFAPGVVSDRETHASDAETHASTHVSDAESHASTHASGADFDARR